MQTPPFKRRHPHTNYPLTAMDSVILPKEDGFPCLIFNAAHENAIFISSLVRRLSSTAQHVFKFYSHINVEFSGLIVQGYSKSTINCE